MKKRGTGYVATHASWEGGDGRVFATFPIDRSARPWGTDPPYLKDSTAAPAEGAPMEAYWRRYAGGKGKPGGPQASVYGIGAWGEALPKNGDGLRRWYAGQSAAHQAEWDGEPTIEEAFDAAFSNQYPSAFYGGGGDEVIASAADWDARRFILNAALARGEIRQLGDVYVFQGVGEAQPTRFLIQWMPDGATPPPPPPPLDDEEDDTPPPPLPADEPCYERLVIPPGIADTMSKIGGWIPSHRPNLRRRAEALEEWLLAQELYVRKP